MKYSLTRSTYTRALTILLLFGFALRVIQVAKQPFSGDEAFTITNWLSASFSDLITTIAQIDPQPPVALLTITAWLHLVGTSEFAARLLSVLASTFTIALTASFAKRLFSPRPALLAALLSTLNPYQLATAQDLRQYALWIMISTLSATLLYSRLSTTTFKPKNWLAYTITSVVATLTFYFEVFFLAVQNLTALLVHRNQPRWLTRWAVAQLIVLALMAISLAIRGLSGYRPTAGVPDIPNTLQTLTIGETYPYASTTNAFVTPLITALASLCLLRRFPPRPSLYLIAYIIIPLTLLTILTVLSQQGYSRPRYVAPASVTLMIVFAAAFTSTPDHTPNRIVAPAATAILVTVMLISNLHYTYNPAFSKAPTWPTLNNYLAGNVTSRDLVIQNYPDPAFTYYYHGSAPAIIEPSVARAPHTFTQNELAAATVERDYIWFLPVPNPNWDADQFVSTWLNENNQKITEQWVGTIHVIQYGTWFPSKTAIRHPTTITFANTAQLDGYNIHAPTNLQPSNTLTLELFITPTSPTPQPLTLFVHLLTNTTNPQLLTQDDHPPHNNQLITQSWAIGKTIRDIANLTIPPNTPPGTYIISIGFYDPATGIRTMIATTTPQPEPNGAQLTEITITN